MGSFLLAAGEPGMRVALTNSRIMIHQPSGGAQGMAADIEIQAREILRMRQRLNELYAKYTGKKIEEIEKAMDRDKFLEADEAKAFGIIDEVFDTRPEAGEDAGTGRGGDHAGLTACRACALHPPIFQHRSLTCVLAWKDDMSAASGPVRRIVRPSKYQSPFRRDEREFDEALLVSHAVMSGLKWRTRYSIELPTSAIITNS